MGAAHVKENVPALGLKNSFHLVGHGRGLTDMFGRFGGGVVGRFGQGGGNREHSAEDKQAKFHPPEIGELRAPCREGIARYFCLELKRAGALQSWRRQDQSRL